MKTFTVLSVEKGVLVFVVFALLFNGVALYKSAELIEHGVVQDRLTALALPVKMLSEKTGFFYVRDVVAETVGVWLNKKESKE